MQDEGIDSQLFDEMITQSRKSKKLRHAKNVPSKQNGPKKVQVYPYTMSFLGGEYSKRFIGADNIKTHAWGTKKIHCETSNVHL